MGWLLTVRGHELDSRLKHKSSLSIGLIEEKLGYEVKRLIIMGFPFGFTELQILELWGNVYTQQVLVEKTHLIVVPLDF